MRSGVELGEYVYRRGELLFGLGRSGGRHRHRRAGAGVHHGLCSQCRYLAPASEAEGGTDTGRHATRAGGGASATGGSGKEIRETPDGEDRADSFTAEDVLREALIKLWEQARNRSVAAIGMLEIRMFESGDGFRLLGAVGAVPGAEKVVTMRGGYETSADGGIRAGVPRTRARCAADPGVP